MTYKGYTIYRELSGWYQSEVDEEGNPGLDVGFVEDDGPAWYSACDDVGFAVATELSIEELKAAVDARVGLDAA